MILQGIYKITNKINGKIYIGYSSYMPGRWKHHKISLRIKKHSNKKLQKDYDEFGNKSFVFEILEEIKDYWNLPKKEISWIKKFDKDILYNRARNWK